MEWGIFDYCVFLIIGIGIIYGVYRGFIMSAAGALSSVVSWVGALAFTKPLALVLDRQYSLVDKVIYLAQSSDTITNITVRKSPMYLLTDSQISQTFQQMEMTKFFKNYLQRVLTTTNVDKTQTFGDFVDTTIATFILHLLSFLGLFIVIFVLCLVIRALIQHSFKIPGLRIGDGIIGAGFGAIQGLLFIFIVFSVLPMIFLIVPDSMVAEFLGDISQTPVAGKFYEHNIILNGIIRMLT
ncbi:MAG: CvpA family protein [Clostridiales bacterium]|nr:CvpA family protein [Clostridiales bacterium]